VLKRQLTFAFLASFVFVGRVISDVLKLFSWIIGPRISPDRDAMVIKWNSVMNFIKKYDK
jgi:hypothetical protein